MNDEEYIFHETNRERKRNGYGDYHKKRQGGKVVKLPSDKLSRKEREALNGKVEVYKMNAPVDYETFKRWPDNIKVEYIKGLRRTYGARTSHICKMMHVGGDTMQKLLRELGINEKRGGATHLRKEEWEAFCAGAKPVEAPKEEVKAEPPKVEPVKAEVSADETDSFWKIECLLRGLIGTGAKLTIEVTL